MKNFTLVNDLKGFNGLVTIVLKNSYKVLGFGL
ncbi:hypothetical protein SAMN05444144_10355 [Flavobacterium akiainvivens]|nr:hypothetical protein SAMN05444144_10355 [Flavobacterium akiainvivens]